MKKQMNEAASLGIGNAVSLAKENFESDLSHNSWGFLSSHPSFYIADQQCQIAEEVLHEAQELNKKSTEKRKMEEGDNN